MKKTPRTYLPTSIRPLFSFLAIFVVHVIGPGCAWLTLSQRTSQGRVDLVKTEWDQLCQRALASTSLSNYSSQSLESEQAKSVPSASDITSRAA